MHYRIYIDTLFAMNFLADYFLLLLTRRMIRCTATHLSLILGSALGAGLTCGIILLPGIPAAYKIVLAYGVINFLMVAVSLRLRKAEAILRGMGWFYLGAFVIGGMLRWAFTQIPFLRDRGISVLSVSAVFYFFFLFFSRLIRRFQERKSQVLCGVTLKVGKEIEVTRGIVDTGNQLYEPITGRPVCIADKVLLERYINQNLLRGFCVIPYHSIGKTKGILKGYEIEELRIEWKDIQIRQKNVIVAVSEEGVSASNQYQMILHPKLLEN